MLLRNRLLVFTIVCTLAMCQLALAQYSPGMPTPGTTSPAPGSPGYVGPKSYGVNKAMVGAGVGAVAAGGILFYTLKHRGVYEGCVSPDGKTLTRKDGKRFQLEGQSLARGNRVSFKAKKSEDDSTGSTLDVQDIRKDFGPCEPQEAAAAAIKP